jgi:hypothetical protein
MSWDRWHPEQVYDLHSWPSEQMERHPHGQIWPTGHKPKAGDGGRKSRRSIIMNFLKSRHGEMVREYDATHTEGEDDFDVCAWCVANCSPESYKARGLVHKKKLTDEEVNGVRQAILHHYFATIICRKSYRRQFSIV